MPASPVRRLQASQLAPQWSLEGALGKGVPEHAGAYCVSDGALVAEAVTPRGVLEGMMEPLLGRAEGGGVANGTREEAAVDLRKEASGLLQLAAPLLVENLSGMGLLFVTTLFVGHLNQPLVLSAMVLATSVYNISGQSVVSGLASAMETLAGQAYGAGNYAMLGVVLQRATASCVLVCLPVIALWSQMGKVLSLLGQDPQVAQLAGQYIRWLMPGVLLTSFGEPTLHYLLAQRVAVPSMAANLLTLALAPLLNWLFIYRLGWGLAGAGAAVLSSTGLIAVLLVGYRVVRDSWMLAGAPKQTWFGLSWSALAGWPQYLAFGLPAVLMVCVEWWLWEAIIILAGVLPNGGQAVGVAGLAIQIAWMPYLVSYSMGTACSTRVANALGAGHARRAKHIYRLAVMMIFLATLLMASAVALFQDAFVGIFTQEPSISAMTKAVLPVVAVGILADGQVAVLNGVLRASGRQLLGAGLHAVVMWGLGLPLAWFLGFRAGWGVKGMWMALVTCTSLQAVIFHTVMALCDWEREVKRAQALTAPGGAFDFEQDGHGLNIGDDVEGGYSAGHGSAGHGDTLCNGDSSTKAVPGHNTGNSDGHSAALGNGQGHAWQQQRATSSQRHMGDG